MSDPKGQRIRSRFSFAYKLRTFLSQEKASEITFHQENWCSGDGLLPTADHGWPYGRNEQKLPWSCACCIPRV